MARPIPLLAPLPRDQPVTVGVFMTRLDEAAGPRSPPSIVHMPNAFGTVTENIRYHRYFVFEILLTNSQSWGKSHD